MFNILYGYLKNTPTTLEDRKQVSIIIYNRAPGVASSYIDWPYYIYFYESLYVFTLYLNTNN